MTRDLIQDKTRDEYAERVSSALNSLHSHGVASVSSLKDLRGYLGFIDANIGTIFDSNDRTRVSGDAEAKIKQFFKALKNFDDLAGGPIVITINGEVQ